MYKQHEPRKLKSQTCHLKTKWVQDHLQKGDRDIKIHSLTHTTHPSSLNTQLLLSLVHSSMSKSWGLLQKSVLFAWFFPYFDCFFCLFVQETHVMVILGWVRRFVLPKGHQHADLQKETSKIDVPTSLNMTDTLPKALPRETFVRCIAKPSIRTIFFRRYLRMRFLCWENIWWAMILNTYPPYRENMCWYASLKQNRERERETLRERERLWERERDSRVQIVVEIFRCLDTDIDI